MAQPSIRARIQIEDGPIWDTFEQFGLIYIESDDRMAAPEKKRETTSYAEEEGEHTDLRVVSDSFDYKVKFLIECPNTDLENANAKIKAFNSRIRDINAATGIKTCKRIRFYNDYKRVLISGIPEILAEPTEFYRQTNGKVLDCVLIELTIHVDRPSECDFALDSGTDKPIVESVVFNSELGYNDAQNIEQLKLGHVTINFGKGSHSSYAPRYWGSDESLRGYRGNTMYFDAGVRLIQQIVFTTVTGTTLHLETSVGKLDSRTWTGNNYYVPFEFTDTTLIKSITVTMR